MAIEAATPRARYACDPGQSRGRLYPEPASKGLGYLVTSLFANAADLPTSRTVFSSTRPKSSISFATRPVQPVW